MSIAIPMSIYIVLISGIPYHPCLCRLHSHMNVLFWGTGDFPVSYLTGIPRGTLEIFIQEGLWSIRGSYSVIWSLTRTNVKWHSDPRPVKVTSSPIRLFTNSMTLIPSLTFAELWVVSMDHLQRVWYASRERLPFRTPCYVPFWTCLCTNCWDQFSRTRRVFSRLFTSICFQWITGKVYHMLNFNVFILKSPRQDKNLWKERFFSCKNIFTILFLKQGVQSVMHLLFPFIKAEDAGLKKSAAGAAKDCEWAVREGSKMNLFYHEAAADDATLMKEAEEAWNSNAAGVTKCSGDCKAQVIYKIQFWQKLNSQLVSFITCFTEKLFQIIFKVKAKRFFIITKCLSFHRSHRIMK